MSGKHKLTEVGKRAKIGCEGLFKKTPAGVKPERWQCVKCSYTLALTCSKVFHRHHWLEHEIERVESLNPEIAEQNQLIYKAQLEASTSSARFPKSEEERKKKARLTIQRELVEFLCVEGLSFELLDSPYLQRLVERVLDGATPTKSSATELLDQIYAEIRGEMDAELTTFRTASFDCWLGREDNLLLIGVHSVDSDFYSNMALLDAIALTQPPTAAYLNSLFSEATSRIPLRYISGTMNYSAAASQLLVADRPKCVLGCGGHHFHLLCFDIFCPRRPPDLDPASLDNSAECASGRVRKRGEVESSTRTGRSSSVDDGAAEVEGACLEELRAGTEDTGFTDPNLRRIVPRTIKRCFQFINFFHRSPTANLQQEIETYNQSRGPNPVEFPKLFEMKQWSEVNSVLGKFLSCRDPIERWYDTYERTLASAGNAATYGTSPVIPGDNFDTSDDLLSLEDLTKARSSSPAAVPRRMSVGEWVAVSGIFRVFTHVDKCLTQMYSADVNIHQMACSILVIFHNLAVREVDTELEKMLKTHLVSRYEQHLDLMSDFEYNVFCLASLFTPSIRRPMYLKKIATALKTAKMEACVEGNTAEIISLLRRVGALEIIAAASPSPARIQKEEIDLSALDIEIDTWKNSPPFPADDERLHVTYWMTPGRMEAFWRSDLKFQNLKKIARQFFNHRCLSVGSEIFFQNLFPKSQRGGMDAETMRKIATVKFYLQNEGLES